MSTNGTNDYSSPPRLVTHSTGAYPSGPHPAQPAPLPAPFLAAEETGRCPQSTTGQACRPVISTYGTTSASLGDYDHKLGDAGFEAHLARCKKCGQTFAGISPYGVYADEPGFESRVRWVPVADALVGEQ